MTEAALNVWRGVGAVAIPARVHGAFVELHRRNPAVSLAGWLMMAGLLVASLALMVDERTIGGVSVWLKPAKFAASIAVYLWTLAWLVHYLKSRRAESVTRLIALVMALEFFLIFSQSARGTASHFNSTTLYDTTVYRTMGVLILANTFALAYLTVRFFRSRPAIPAPYLVGIRLGMLLFLLSAVSGGIMIGMVSHDVGASGDLRVAHFVAMHTLQAVPVAGLAAHVLESRALLRNATTWTKGFALVMFLAHAFALITALSGRSIG